MNKKVLGASLGAIILIGVIVAGILIYNNQSKTPEVVINGLVGGEKIELFENETFKKIAKKNTIRQLNIPNQEALKWQTVI